MTKRKYKIFIDIVLILLCLFPLISLLFVVGTSSTILTGEQLKAHVLNYCISGDLADKIGNAINTFGIAFDGNFFPAVSVIMANSLLIYLFYVFVACLTWLPKFAINILERASGQKY